MGLVKNIITGKDNQTHDIVRVAMVFVTAGLVGAFFAGCFAYIYGYFYSLSHVDAKLLPIQDFFTATTTFAIGAGGFLASGSGALLLKKTTEPDGTQTTTESIRSGPGSGEPEVVRKTETTVNLPGSTVVNVPET